MGAGTGWRSCGSRCWCQHYRQHGQYRQYPPVVGPLVGYKGGAKGAGGVDAAAVQWDEHRVALQRACGGGGGEGGGGGGGERAGTHGTSGSWLPSAGLPCGERRVRTRKTANPMAMGARPLVEGGEFLSMAVMCTT